MEAKVAQLVEVVGLADGPVKGGTICDHWRGEETKGHVVQQWSGTFALGFLLIARYDRMKWHCQILFRAGLLIEGQIIVGYGLLGEYVDGVSQS